MSKSSSPSKSSGGSTLFIILIVVLAAIFIIQANNSQHNFFEIDEASLKTPKFISDIVGEVKNSVSSKNKTETASPPAKEVVASKKTKKNNISDDQKDSLIHRDRAELEELLDKVGK